MISPGLFQQPGISPVRAQDHRAAQAEQQMLALQLLVTGTCGDAMHAPCAATKQWIRLLGSEQLTCAAPLTGIPDFAPLMPQQQNHVAPGSLSALGAGRSAQLAADALWRGSGQLRTFDGASLLDDCSLWKESGSIPEGLLPTPNVKSALDGFKAEEWLQEDPNADSSNTNTPADDAPHKTVTSGTPSVCASAAGDTFAQNCGGASAMKPRVEAGSAAEPALAPPAALSTAPPTAPSAAPSAAPSVATSGNREGSHKEDDHDTPMQDQDDDAMEDSLRSGSGKRGDRKAPTVRVAMNSPREAGSGGVKKVGGGKGGKTRSNVKSHASVQQRYRERQKAKTVELQEARQQLLDQAQNVDVLRLEANKLKERLSQLEVRVAVVDSQLVVASLRLGTATKLSQTHPGCPSPSPLAFITPLSTFSRHPSLGNNATSRDALQKEQVDLDRLYNSPSPFTTGPNHPLYLHGNSSCLSTFKVGDQAGSSDKLPIVGCGPGNARGTPEAVPKEASQLPVHLQSTLKILQNFMVELQAASVVPVTEQSIRPDDNAKLAKLVHACCTACMNMQAASLEFDFASIFQHPFATAANPDGTMFRNVSTRNSACCDLSFWSSNPRMDSLRAVSNRGLTQAGNAPKLASAIQCMPGAPAAKQVGAPGSRTFENVSGEPNRQQQLARILADVVTRLNLSPAEKAYAHIVLRAHAKNMLLFRNRRKDLRLEALKAVLPDTLGGLTTCIPTRSLNTRQQRERCMATSATRKLSQAVLYNLIAEQQALQELAFVVCRRVLTPLQASQCLMLILDLQCDFAKLLAAIVKS